MSIRDVGSYIGHNRVTTTAQNSASGIWSLAAVERRRRAAAWPVPASPATIAGLQLWLDGSDASTLFDATSGGSLVAADGGVARWEDKSGNARHATQGTSENRPLRKTAIQGGKDVLRFDGSNDSLSIASSTATFKFLHSADSTVFMVLTRPSGADHVLLATYNTSGSNVGWCLFSGNGSATGDRLSHQIANGVVDGENVTQSVVNLTSNGFLPSGWSVVSIVDEPTNATAANRSSIRRNGGAATKNNIRTNSVSTSNATHDLRIGASGAQQLSETRRHAACDIAEIIIYDSALSDADREKVENYLLAKWAIT